MTSTPVQKPHYPILDGLRGVAAILVVIYHLFEAYYLDPADHPEHHGYLAVDFFFLLSGFVVGYAYDDRWQKKMTVWDFFKIRLVRLHPMVVLSVVIGAIAFWFDPFTKGRDTVGFLQLTGTMLLAFTLLPSPDVRGWKETHSLDGPCWSLLQEYIANILYALAGRKLNKWALAVVVAVCAVVLTGVAAWHGNLATGWSYETFWIGMVRMMFPFFAGLLLFRLGILIRLPMAFPFCSLMLVVLFFIPTLKYNGIYEAACIILVFPLIVAAGAGGNIKGTWAKVCKFSGDISYPIYITHYPFIYVYTMWVVNEKPAPSQIVPVACALFALFIAIAYASLKFYDEPVRAWLKKKVL